MIDGSAEAHVRPGASATRVGLALGAVVLGAVVIFGLGVMEGSRVAELAPVAAAPPRSLPTQSLAPPATAPSAPSAPVVPAAATAPDKLTFYDRLSGVSPAAPPAPPEGQAPFQVLVPAAPAPPATREHVLPQPSTPTPAPTAGALARTTAATTPTEVASRAPAPPKAGPAAKIKKLEGRGRFAVQVAAVSERAAAAEAAALVKRNGFDSVTVMASIKGKVWYRIRVGSFPSKQAATQAAGIFHSAFGLNAIPVEN